MRFSQQNGCLDLRSCSCGNGRRRPLFGSHDISVGSHNPAERPMYIASMGLLWGGGSVLGPVIGGAFADSSATWRWSFYINLCVAALFAPVYLFMLPSVDPQPTKSIFELFKQVDYVGSILILGTFCCGITGLSFGGSLFAWKSATIIVLLSISVVLLVLFGIQQVYCVFTTFERRLLPAQYFKSRTLALQFITSFMLGGPIFIPVYFIPIFFQFTKGDRALDAAVRLLPFMFMLVFFSLLNGAAMGKDGHYTPWYLFASVLVVIGSALMYTVDENSSTPRIYGYSAILGIGAGCVVQTAFIVAQASVPHQEMSSGKSLLNRCHEKTKKTNRFAAIALINLAQIGGLVISLTLANTIFLNLAFRNIGNVLPNADSENIKSLVSGTSSVVLQSLDADTRRHILHAIVDPISDVYVLCIAYGGAALLLCLGMKWEKVVLIL